MTTFDRPLGPRLFAVALLAACVLALVIYAPVRDRMDRVLSDPGDRGQAEAHGARQPEKRLGGRPRSFKVSLPILRAGGIVWASKRLGQSSEYGADRWSALQALGPPDVYPTSGDVDRAWATSLADGGAEWLEVGFDGEEAARAVLIVETCNPGALTRVESIAAAGSGGAAASPATEASPVTEEGTSDRDLLWGGRAPTVDGQARVLRIDLVEPTVIRALRLELDSAGVPGWNEIDAVGLVIADLPEMPPETAADTSLPPPTASGPGAATVPYVASTVAGTAYQEWVLLERTGFPGVVWAAATLGTSSDYHGAGGRSRAAVGPPDVYPAYADSALAWTPTPADGGFEWLSVVFDRPHLAQAVIVLETLGAGALVRVDDLTRIAAPEALWAGRLPSAEARARAARFDLAEPRSIAALRLVLDTGIVAGWSEIDAVGLVLAEAGEDAAAGR